jgi:regulator-associated protein of mTOR
LQAAGHDLRPVLIFIWARIPAVDPSVQQDLYNSHGYRYFAIVLAVQEDASHPALLNSSEHKATCASIPSAMAWDIPQGQMPCFRERVFDNCVDRLNTGDFLLRRWSAHGIGQMWDSNDDIKVCGVDRVAQDVLITLLSDDSPEVRSAALFALGTFLGATVAANPSKQGGRGSKIMYHLEERIHLQLGMAVVAEATLAVKDDANPMARKEFLVLISSLVKEWRGCFVVCAWLASQVESGYGFATARGGLHYGGGFRMVGQIRG